MRNPILVTTYKGGISKNVFILIDKAEKIDAKSDRFTKMRDLRIKIDKYYEQIINPKKNIEDNDIINEEDEKEKLRKKEEERFDLINNC